MKNCQFLMSPWDLGVNTSRKFNPRHSLAITATVVFDFLKHLPLKISERREVIRYLDFNIKKLDEAITGKELDEREKHIAEANFLASLEFHLKSACNDDQAPNRDEMAAGMAQVNFDRRKLPVTTMPDYFQQLSASERAALWSQCQELLRFMPATDANFIFVLDWLRSMGLEDRKDLMTYLNKLPEGEEGLKTLVYFEYWRVDPRDALVRGRTTFSLWFHISDPATLWTCHVLILFVIVLFTLGFATRVTSVMTWLAALFYIHRNNSILFGMDTMMNVLLFYLMIGPSGAALSIDRLIARYRAARAIFKAGHQPVPWADAVLAGPRPSAMANFTIRLIQIHFCFIYMASGLAKLKGWMWWNTTATWYTIANPEFTPLYYRVYESLLRTLATSKVLLLIVFGMMSYFTLFVEISLPFLVWTRVRPYIVCLAIFLHSGIAWIMGLTCFGLLMMAFLLSYIPAAVIRERLTWTPGTGRKLTLRYNSHNPRHGRVVAFLRAFDLAGQIAFHDDSSKKSDDDLAVQLVDDSHRVATGDEIISSSMRKLLLLRWFVYIPGVEYLARRLVGVPPADELTAKQMDYRQPVLPPKGNS